MAGSSWPTFTQNTRTKASEVDLRFDWLEGDIVPQLAGIKADATYDLGLSTFRWRDIYASRQYLASSGTSSLPAFAQQGNNSNGLYFPTTSSIGPSNRFALQNGTVAETAMGFVNDYDTGLYLPSIGSMGIAVSGAAVEIYHADGNITYPLNCKFIAEKESTLINGSTNITNFTSASYDAGSDMDESSGIFIAPIDGIYIFNLACTLVRVTTTAWYWDVNVQVKNLLIPLGREYNATTSTVNIPTMTSVAVSYMTFLSAGDSVASNINSLGHNVFSFRFCGALIG